MTNTSPLIFLAKIDALPLLQDCFGEILAPPAVVKETRLSLPPFVRRTHPSELSRAWVQGALGALHQGELEAMALARETGSELIALDDRMARDKARQLGLTPIGTVGLLMLARRRGLIDARSALSKLDALVQVHGLYLSARVLKEVRDNLSKSP